MEVTAHQLAEAFVVALSYSFVNCEANGGWACAFSGSSIEDTARAVATAYAGAWADAYTCQDTCDAGIDEVATAVGDVLVTAATSVWSEVCVGAAPTSPVIMLTCHAAVAFPSELDK